LIICHRINETATEGVDVHGVAHGVNHMPWGKRGFFKLPQGLGNSNRVLSQEPLPPIATIRHRIHLTGPVSHAHLHTATRLA
jgi:hypothetical protein